MIQVSGILAFVMRNSQLLFGLLMCLLTVCLLLPFFDKGRFALLPRVLSVILLCLSLAGLLPEDLSVWKHALAIILPPAASPAQSWGWLFLGIFLTRRMLFASNTVDRGGSGSRIWLARAKQWPYVVPWVALGSALLTVVVAIVAAGAGFVVSIPQLPSLDGLISIAARLLGPMTEPLVAVYEALCLKPALNLLVLLSLQCRGSLGLGLVLLVLAPGIPLACAYLFSYRRYRRQIDAEQSLESAYRRGQIHDTLLLDAASDVSGRVVDSPQPGIRGCLIDVLVFGFLAWAFVSVSGALSVLAVPVYNLGQASLLYSGVWANVQPSNTVLDGRLLWFDVTIPDYSALLPLILGLIAVLKSDSEEEDAGSAGGLPGEGRRQYVGPRNFVALLRQLRDAIKIYAMMILPAGVLVYHAIWTSAEVLELRHKRLAKRRGTPHKATLGQTGGI